MAGDVTVALLPFVVVPFFHAGLVDLDETLVDDWFAHSVVFGNADGSLSRDCRRSRVSVLGEGSALFC